MSDVKKLNVLLHGERIGILTFDGRAYTFAYEPGKAPHPLSLSLPLSPHSLEEKSNFTGGFRSLPGYFENLLPEGWLLEIVKDLSLESKDKLDLLHHVCRDTLGAVSFSKDGENPEDMNLASGVAQPTSIGVSHEGYPLACLHCAERLPHRGYNGGFHELCSMTFFGTEQPPSLDVDRQNLRKIAEAHLLAGESVTGSQAKFSLKYKYREKSIIVPGYSFIVKPKQMYAEIHDLPRTEHILMRFAGHMGLGVAETAFIKLRDGNDAFITKRFDRTADGGKIHAEDMSQATGVARGAKGRYQGSLELIAKTLNHPLAAPEAKKKSKERFLHSCLFNFIFGNTDAHLKNHSIIWKKSPPGNTGFSLSPFYDIVPCALYTTDIDELGLKLGGRNHNFKKKDFERFAEENLGLPPSMVGSFLSAIRGERRRLLSLLDAYEIKDSQKKKLMDLAADRIGRLSETAPAIKTPPFEITGPTQIPGVQEAESSQPESSEFCASEICLNPAGRTKLKGSRRRLGICSFCQPELSRPR